MAKKKQPPKAKPLWVDGVPTAEGLVKMGLAERVPDSPSIVKIHPEGTRLLNEMLVQRGRENRGKHSVLRRDLM